jgi:ABC-2 type transport system ATP-binding protein
MIEVQLHGGDDVQHAAVVLGEVLGNGGAPDVSQTESVLRFETAESDDRLGEILSQLIGAGVRVTQFREVASDLEDAFLSVTRDDHDSGE